MRYRAQSSLLTTCLLVLLTVTSLTVAAPAGGDTLNKIVLRVNDEILTQRDYERRKASEVSRLLADPSLDPSTRQERLGQIGKQIVKLTFEEMLISSRARQLGFTVSETQVDEMVTEVREQQGIQSTEQLIQALQASGMTMEDFRDRWRRDLLANQVIGREVWGEIEVGEEELRAYYRNHRDDFRVPEERWLKEVIVLESSGLDDAELRRTAQQLRQELSKADDIEAVVAGYRERGLSTSVIDLDWLRAADLEETLAQVAFAVEPGEFAAPVKARGGYHICFVEEVREASLRPFKDVQGEILQRERNKRFQKELRTYMANLERDAYVQENLPSEAVGYRALADDPEDETEFDFFAPTPEAAEDATNAVEDATAEG